MRDGRRGRARMEGERDSRVEAGRKGQKERAAFDLGRRRKRRRKGVVNGGS